MEDGTFYEETLLYEKCVEMKSGKILAHVSVFVRGDSDDGKRQTLVTWWVLYWWGDGVVDSVCVKLVLLLLCV